MTETMPALEAGPRPRPRSQFVATGFAVAAGSMMVGGALAFYMARRHASGAHPGHDWVDGIAVPNPQLDFALITLGLSLITAHWALLSSKRRVTSHAWTAIGTTLVLGLAFINMVIYSLNRMELEIGSGEYANLAFATTGLALALAVVGLFYLAFMGIRSVAGNVGREGSAPLAAAVFFWDFVAVAWTATWYVVYVVK